MNFEQIVVEIKNCTSYHDITQAKSAIVGYHPYAGCEFVQAIEELPEEQRLQLKDLVCSHVALLGQIQNMVRMDDQYRGNLEAQNIEIERRVNLSYRVPFFTTSQV